MRVDLEIRGIQELDRKLRDLPDKIARGIIRTAVRNAQKIVLAALKTRTAALPFSERWKGLHRALMEKAWELRVPKRQQAGSYAIHVQLARNDALIHTTKAGKRHYIPAAIEFGHDNVPPVPFARPVTDETKGLVEMVLADDLGRGIEKAAQE